MFLPFGLVYSTFLGLPRAIKIVALFLTAVIVPFMSSVTLFKSYLKEKAREKELLSLYHHLCFFCEGEKELTRSLIQAFYRKALLFPHWQSRLSFLRARLTEALLSFSEATGPLGFDPKKEPPADQWQWIRVKHERDRLNMVRRHLKSRKAPEERVQVLPMEGDKVLGLLLKPKAGLQAFVFGPLALIEQGQIEPLSPLSVLNYNAQYELCSDVRQTLEMEEGHFVHFQVQREKATGQSILGPAFQPLKEFQQKRISDLVFLFLPLKRLESLFIEPSSDPHYQGLLRSLNQSYHQLLTCPEESSLKAELALFQAQKALKNLYPHDPLLLLLTANIEFHLRKHKRAYADSGSPPSPLEL